MAKDSLSGLSRLLGFRRSPAPHSIKFKSLSVTSSALFAAQDSLPLCPSLLPFLFLCPIKQIRYFGGKGTERVRTTAVERILCTTLACRRPQPTDQPTLQDETMNLFSTFILYAKSIEMRDPGMPHYRALSNRQK